MPFNLPSSLCLRQTAAVLMMRYPDAGDVQEQVAVATDLLKARGIPTWMDIDGGMQTDIYNR